jgi:hypothetical protein
MQFSGPSSDIQRHAATLRRCLLSLIAAAVALP